jgi:hypothetical protein
MMIWKKSLEKILFEGVGCIALDEFLGIILLKYLIRRRIVWIWGCNVVEGSIIYNGI